MSQLEKPRLRRAKVFLGRPNNDSIVVHSKSSDLATPDKVRRMLRILLKSPWDDYRYIRHLGQAKLAQRKDSSFQLTEIREVSELGIAGEPPILPRIQHPNIATIHDIYSHNNTIFSVTEHLEVSFAQLEVQKYDLEEREIATIIASVCRHRSHQREGGG